MTTDTHTGLRALDDLRRNTRNLRSILARQASGQLTGRNADATQDTIDYRLRQGRELVSTICDSPLAEAKFGRAFDAFWAVERRALGLDR